MNRNMREMAQKLAARPYTVRILRDDSDSDQPLFLALNPELEGCMAQGESIAEAVEFLAEFRVDYIEHLLEHNLPVPYPATMATTTSSIASGTVKTLRFDAQPTVTFDLVLKDVIQPEDRELLGEASLKT